MVKKALYLKNGVESDNYNVKEIINLGDGIHFPGPHGFYNDYHTPKRLTDE